MTAADKYEIVGKPIVLNYRNGYGYWIGNVLNGPPDKVSRDPLTDCHSTPEDAFRELGALVTHLWPVARSRHADLTRDDL